MKDCDQFREMFEAYALGALDANERAALDAHLATGCAHCAQSVEEARWLVSQLAYLAPEAVPSDLLKGRLLRTVRAEAQAARAAQAAKKSKPVVSAWLWAGLAALLVFSLYSAWNMQRLQREVQIANERAAALLRERLDLEAQRAAAEREATILIDPASVKIPLASSDPQAPTLEATWHSKLGIVLTGQKVPIPPGNRVLQLWLIPTAPGGKPIPSLTVRPDADGKFTLLVSNPPGLMETTQALAITEEPAGGSPQPTTTPRWLGKTT